MGPGLMESLEMNRPERSPETQDVHDRVIRKIALTKVDPLVFHAGVNPGRSREWPVRHLDVGRVLFPDLVVKSKRSGHVHAAYEVETEETVNEDHAELEWKPFGAAGCKFTLVVPKSKLAETMELIEEYQIRVDILGSYEVDPAGWITLDLPGPRRSPFEMPQVE